MTKKIYMYEMKRMYETYLLRHLINVMNVLLLFMHSFNNASCQLNLTSIYVIMSIKDIALHGHIC